MCPLPELIFPWMSLFNRGTLRVAIECRSSLKRNLRETSPTSINVEKRRHRKYTKFAEHIRQTTCPFTSSSAATLTQDIWAIRQAKGSTGFGNTGLMTYSKPESNGQHN